MLPSRPVVKGEGKRERRKQGKKNTLPAGRYHPNEPSPSGGNLCTMHKKNMARRRQCQNIFPANRARLVLRLCSSLSGPYSPLPARHCRTVGEDGAGNHTSASQLRTARFSFLQRLFLTSILTIFVSPKPLHRDKNPSTPLCRHLSLPYPSPPAPAQLLPRSSF